MKHVDVKSLAVVMTRSEKLVRWAELIRLSYRQLNLYHDLERLPLYALSDIQLSSAGDSAFGVAMGDPLLNAAGLPTHGSMRDIVDFFEIDQRELHEFSCDCGGVIPREEMARRMERLAHKR